MPKFDVVIVGAGLAGLSCALDLQRKGIEAHVFEADSEVGGRMRTDKVDGFLLDRGFQVLLAAYPECRRQLDYPALQMKSFHSGALVWADGKLDRLGDPSRHWSDMWPSLSSTAGDWQDKVRVGALVARLLPKSLEDIYRHPQTTTIDYLRSAGFSSKFIGRFWRPFLAGIFLDQELLTSSRKFELVFRMFAAGTAALPAGGVQAVPQQLAQKLQHGTLHLGMPISRLIPSGIELQRSGTVESRVVVLAVSLNKAMGLLGKPVPISRQAVTTVYFSADESPLPGPWLVLNGSGQGLVNTWCVPSEVQGSYAPPGKALVSVSVIRVRPDVETLAGAIRSELRVLLGDAVEGWQLLRGYPIADALPSNEPAALTPVVRQSRIGEGLYWCGDHLQTASQEGALASGRQASAAVYSDISGTKIRPILE